MEELREEIIESKEIYRGRILQVKLEKVVLPDGTHSQREVVYHPGAAAIIPLTEAGRVILVKQFRLPAGKVLLEIPAGTLDKGESPEACAERELAEEIGMHPGKLERLCSIFLAPGYSSELIHIFLATKLSPAAAKADADERLIPEEKSLSETLGMIKRKEIQDAKTIVALLLAAQNIEKARS